MVRCSMRLLPSRRRVPLGFPGPLYRPFRTLLTRRGEVRVCVCVTDGVYRWMFWMRGTFWYGVFLIRTELGLKRIGPLYQRGGFR